MGRVADAIAWLITRFVADVIIDGRHVATFRGFWAHRRAADFALGWTVRGMHDRRSMEIARQQAREWRARQRVGRGA